MALGKEDLRKAFGDQFGLLRASADCAERNFLKNKDIDLKYLADIWAGYSCDVKQSFRGSPE